MQHAIMCIVKNKSHAESIVADLQKNGFAKEAISVLFPDREAANGFAISHNTKAPEGAVAGASAGGVVGGTLGFLLGLGALAIPGIGLFVAAGPILAALSGLGVGGTVGGIAGALVGMGIPELEAKTYESRIHEGNLFVSVHTDTIDGQLRAEKVLASAGAENIGSSVQGRLTEVAAPMYP